jgi:hypothetical protein
MPTFESSISLNQLNISQSLLKELTSHPPANPPAPNPTKSFWIDSAPDVNPLAREGSEGALTTGVDICIIGSGITGMESARPSLLKRYSAVAIGTHQASVLLIIYRRLWPKANLVIIHI